MDIAVHDLGGAGPPLLLAHATGFHGRVFQPLARHLSARFHCLALDERGHGDSGRPGNRGFEWQGFADDVTAVVDGLDLDHPLAFGHSCGGAALLLAEEARPGTFRTLYCFEPVVVPNDSVPPPDPGNPLSVGARHRRGSFPSREVALANYASKPPLSVLSHEALAAYVEHGFEDLDDGSVRLKCRPEDEASVYAHGGSHDAFTHLDEVRCAVTLACGATTDSFGPGAIALLAERLVRCQVEVLEAMGHFGPLEDPRAVAASVCRAFGTEPLGAPEGHAPKGHPR